MRKIKILFVKNNLSYSIAPDIENLRQWLESLEIKLEVEMKETDFDLKFKDLNYKGYWGVDDLENTLKPYITPLKFNIIFFCYQKPANENRIVNYVHLQDLNSSALAEIIYKEESVGGWTASVLVHETLHCFNALLRWRGINIEDKLDSVDKIEPIINTYKPYLDIMLEDYSIQKKIWFLSDLINFLSSLMKKMFLKKEEIIMPQPITPQAKKETVPEMAKRIAGEMKISEQDYMEGMLVLKCESNFDPNAKFINKNGTIDRGVAQFNSYWYKQVSDKEAYDPEKALRLFWTYFPKRKKDWNCYKKIKGRG